MILFAGVVWRGLTNFRTHLEILQLLKLPPFDEMFRNNPRFAFKYLTHDYLVRGFTVTQRATCFLHHYRRLRGVLPARLLRQTLHWDVTLHEFFEDSNRFALTLGLSRPFDKEGELSINLKVRGDIVFTLSFTIVPGWVVKSGASEILLITRLQGTPGCYAPIKLATKASHQVGPSALLLAALQGIAVALGIREIAAVDAANQSSYSEDFAACFKSAYDDFFAELVMTKTADGFFSSSVPIQDKPLAVIKQGHKLRTKEKRAFKQQIESSCTDFFLRVADQVKITSNVEFSVPTGDAIESRLHGIPCSTLNEELTLQHRDW